MYSVKQVMKVALWNFRTWKKNPRVVTTFVLAFVLCLMLSDKAVSFANSYHTTMQIFETFIWTFGDANSVLISSLLLILLFADMPFMNQGTPYCLIRMKRSIWMAGQVVYVILATLLYTFFLLAVCCILSASVSFPGNKWSETGAMIGYAGIGDSIALPVSMKVMEMSRPFQCASIIFLLLMLYSLLVACILFLFNLKKGTFLGILCVFALQIYGIMLNPEIFVSMLHLPENLLYKANVLTGWLSPLNHATYYMHSFGFDYLPRLWMSCLIFVALIGIILLICRKLIKRYDFSFTQVDEG